MLQAMVDSPEEAEGWDAPQGERPTSAGGTMTSSTLHRILQVSYLTSWLYSADNKACRYCILLLTHLTHNISGRLSSLQIFLGMSCT